MVAVRHMGLLFPHAVPSTKMLILTMMRFVVFELSQFKYFVYSARPIFRGRPSDTFLRAERTELYKSAE